MYSRKLSYIFAFSIVCTVSSLFAEILPERIPTVLVENVGQARADTFATLRAQQHAIHFKAGEVAWQHPDHGVHMHQRFKGADNSVIPQVLRSKSATMNFYLNGPQQVWQNAVPIAKEVRYTDLYPGVDLRYYQQSGATKRDFVVAPYADPLVIAFTYDGASKLEISESGDLLIHTAAGVFSEKAPYTYQLIDGREIAVASAYRLLPNGAVTFILGSYDPAYELVIDPEIDLEVLFGGSGDETAFGIALSADGNTAYICGVTTSADFPVSGTPAQSTYAGDTNVDNPIGDIFVAAVSTVDGTIAWATYLGGSGTDFANGIAFNGSDTLTISGYTDSTDFPTMNPLQASIGGKTDAIIAQFGTDGSLLFSTYLGGSEDDQFADVSYESFNQRWGFVGFSLSSDFPFPDPNGSSADENAASGGGINGLAVSMNSDRTLGWATFLNRSSTANYVLLGCAYSSSYLFATGYTDDVNFDSAAPLQDGNKGGTDLLVVRFDATTTVQRRYSAGGSGDEQGNDIALRFGIPVVVGQTASTDFNNIASSAYQPNYGGGDTDGVLISFDFSDSFGNPEATYLGGSGNDQLRGISTDPNNGIQFAGVTSSTDLIIPEPFDLTYLSGQQTYGGGDTDGIVGIATASSNQIGVTTLAYSGSVETDASTAVTYNPFDVPSSSFSPYFPLSVGASVEIPAQTAAIADADGDGFTPRPLMGRASAKRAAMRRYKERAEIDGADVGVVVSESFSNPFPRVPGDSMTFFVDITNNGPNAAEAVRVDVDVPAQLIITGGTIPGQTPVVSNGSQRISTETFDLPALSSLLFTINMQAVSSGSATISAFALLATADPITGNNDDDYEIFISEPIPGDIAGRIFNDVNHNSTKDDDEDPVTGAELHLIDDQNMIIDTTNTNGLGEYHFIGVDPGMYTVVLGDNVRKDFPETVAPSSGNRIVEVVSSQTSANNDFAVSTFDVGSGAISGKVFKDQDSDGEQDAGEVGLPFIKVFVDLNNNLRHDTGEPVGSSSITGEFIINNVPPGTRVVRILPPGNRSQSFPLPAGSIQPQQVADGDSPDIRPLLVTVDPDTLDTTDDQDFPGYIVDVPEDDMVEGLIYGLETINPAVDFSISYQHVLPNDTLDDLYDDVVFGESSWDGNFVFITVAISRFGGDTDETYTVIIEEDFGLGSAPFPGLPDPFNKASVVVAPDDTELLTFIWDTDGESWDGTTPDYIKNLLFAISTDNGDTFDTFLFDSLPIFPRPVVMLHGLWGDAAQWDSYKTFFEDASYWSAHAVGDGLYGGVLDRGSLTDSTLIGTLADIRANAAATSGYIENMRNDLEAVHVDLVGHFDGGLIGRYYVQNLMPAAVSLDSSPVVRNLVMLGTPNEGHRYLGLLGLAMYLDQQSLNPAPQAEMPMNLLELQPSFIKDMFNKQIVDEGDTVFSAMAGQRNHDLISQFTGLPIDNVGEFAGDDHDGVTDVDGVQAVQSNTADFDIVGVVNTTFDQMLTSIQSFDLWTLRMLDQGPFPNAFDRRDVPPANADKVEVPVAAGVWGVDRNSTEDVSFEVTACDALVAIIPDIPDMQVSLVDPSDVIQSTWTTPGGQGDLLLQYAAVLNPTPGTWKLRLVNSNLAFNYVPYVAIQQTGSPLFTFSVDPDSSSREALVTASIRGDAGGFRTLATANVYIEDRAGELTTLTLVDDGTNGDITAGDGIYSSSVSPIEPVHYFISGEFETSDGLKRYTDGFYSPFVNVPMLAVRNGSGGFDLRWPNYIDPYVQLQSTGDLRDGVWTDVTGLNRTVINDDMSVDQSFSDFNTFFRLILNNTELGFDDSLIVP